VKGGRASSWLFPQTGLRLVCALPETGIRLQLLAFTMNPGETDFYRCEAACQQGLGGGAELPAGLRLLDKHFLTLPNGDLR
jgi:hypothetical protein